MLVTDAAVIGEQDGVGRITAAVRGGVGILQLRDHGAGARELLARAQALRRCFPETLLLVNDRVDIVLATGATGVQLGEGSLPVSAARGLLGESALIGRSVHAVAEARAAEAEGADFLIVGMIHPSATHPERVPAGPALLEAVAAEVHLPLFAIGGITVSNAAECLRRGAHGIALIRAIEGAPDGEVAARRLLAAMDRARIGLGRSV
jgi:thiamine-phosphate pyrophosphorylase